MIVQGELKNQWNDWTGIAIRVREHLRGMRGRMAVSASALVHRLILAAIWLLFFVIDQPARAQDSKIGIDDPIHDYYAAQSQDRFARFLADIESGKTTLDTSNELKLLEGVLDRLEIPVSSQMLVSSATSLQKTRISPSRPRALYFNDDTYVGFVPGGQIEVISIDPKRGGMFYIFDRNRSNAPPRAKKATNCLTCHATVQMGKVPQLVVESVVTDMTGGGEMAFRRDVSGHQIPLADRFGGWLVTGEKDFTDHWGNVLIVRERENTKKRIIRFGELFNQKNYLAPTSDLLPHLLHEHQVGFINRSVQASYQTRVLLQKPGPDPKALAAELKTLANGLVKYLLFAEETSLPSQGIQGSEAFRREFVARRHATSDGRSLRDLDLKTRLLKYRCSYMIESPIYAELPRALRHAIEQELALALSNTQPSPDFAYLPKEEKEAIRTILVERKLLPPAGS